MVLEVQLLHKTVNLLFTITQVDEFVGELTLSNHLINTLCEIMPQKRRFYVASLRESIDSLPLGNKNIR